MIAPTPPQANGPDALPFPDEALLDVLEGISEPAFLFLPGGRIAAVNRAAARLSDISFIGMTVNKLLERYGAHHADGRRLIRGDLPYTRALRGEVVVQGERVAITLPDGSIYRAQVTSTPIVVDGKVVASLSVLHNFDEYVQRLSGRQAPPDTIGPV